MLLTIITFIIILSILVFVHELGHFWVARKFNVKCDEFGMGIPPRMFGIVKRDWVENLKLKFLKKWKIIKGKDKNLSPEALAKGGGYKNTIYSLNWVPLGGFVKIKGEDGESRQDSDSFGAQKIWKRGLIIASGVTMNFIFAMVLFSIGYMVGLPQVIDGQDFTHANVADEKIQIISVSDNSIAAQEGIIIQDELLSIDNQTFNQVNQVQEYIAANINQELTLEIKRGDEILEKKLSAHEIELEDGTTKKLIGIALVKTGTVSYPFFQAIWQGIITTLFLMKLIIVTFYGIIKDLIIVQKLTYEISGPVGIAAVTGQVVQLGFIYVLQFAALLSINLGIINFFPFPALDGGRFIGLIIEAIRRKPNNPKIEALVHNIGFGLLMVLILVITYRDVARFGGRIMEKVFG